MQFKSLNSAIMMCSTQFIYSLQVELFKWTYTRNFQIAFPNLPKYIK